MAQRLLSGLLAFVVVLAGDATPVHAVDPATLVGVLGAAYEVEKAMVEILGAIAKAAGPDRDKEIRDALGRMETEIGKLNDVYGQVEATVKRIEDGLVRDDNVNAVEEVQDALKMVNTARNHLTDECGCKVVDANAESDTALKSFNTFAVRMWGRTGPLISDLRFEPRIAYAGYVASLAVRLAYFQTRYGPGAFTRPDVASELRDNASFLETLRDRITNAVRCQAKPFISGPRGQEQCYVEVTCEDAIAHAPSEFCPCEDGNLAPSECDPKDPNHYNAVHDPGAYCPTDRKAYREPPKAVYPTLCRIKFDEPFYEDEIEGQQRYQYGYEAMASLRDVLNNLATYGRPDGPYVGSFGALTAPIVSVSYGTVIDAIELGNGVRPETWSWSSDPSQWWVFELDGTVRSRLSGQCLDVQAWSTEPGAPVQMWDCHGGDNQQWSRWSDRTIRNVHSGQCLTIACWGQSCAWGGHELTQWPCSGDPTQLFTTQNPDYSDIPR